jgi:hypothetical protein
MVPGMSDQRGPRGKPPIIPSTLLAQSQNGALTASIATCIRRTSFCPLSAVFFPKKQEVKVKTKYTSLLDCAHLGICNSLLKSTSEAWVGLFPLPKNIPGVSNHEWRDQVFGGKKKSRVGCPMAYATCALVPA